MAPKEIWLTEKHRNLMLADVRERAPLEACGLVAGEGSFSQEVYPVENVHQSPVRYLMDPREQLRIFNLLDDRSWELLAIYHSHPQGPPFPSQTDLDEAAYPETVHLIWSRVEGEWRCRGFLLDERNFQEIRVHVVEDP